MSDRLRPRRLSILLFLVVLSGTVTYAHTYVGLQHGSLAGARVQSPNSSVTEFPTPIPGTDLSIVCFRVRNTSPFDSRITAIGLEIPGAPESGYTLISPVDSAFHLVDGASHVPEIKDAQLTFALFTGKTFGGGRPNTGLAPSSTLTSFCVSGPFPRDVAIERMLDRGVLRFQRVGEEGEDSDVSVWTDRPR
jgi:hypothetical protein